METPLKEASAYLQNAFPENSVLPGRDLPPKECQANFNLQPVPLTTADADETLKRVGSFLGDFERSKLKQENVKVQMRAAPFLLLLLFATLFFPQSLLVMLKTRMHIHSQSDMNNPKFQNSKAVRQRPSTNHTSSTSIGVGEGWTRALTLGAIPVTSEDRHLSNWLLQAGAVPQPRQGPHGSHEFGVRGQALGEGCGPLQVRIRGRQPALARSPGPQRQAAVQREAAGRIVPELGCSRASLSSSGLHLLGRVVLLELRVLWRLRITPGVVLGGADPGSGPAFAPAFGAGRPSTPTTAAHGASGQGFGAGSARGRYRAGLSMATVTSSRQDPLLPVIGSAAAAAHQPTLHTPHPLDVILLLKLNYPLAHCDLAFSHHLHPLVLVLPAKRLTCYGLDSSLLLARPAQMRSSPNSGSRGCSSFRECLAQASAHNLLRSVTTIPPGGFDSAQQKTTISNEKSQLIKDFWEKTELELKFYTTILQLLDKYSIAEQLIRGEMVLAIRCNSCVLEFTSELHSQLLVSLTIMKKEFFDNLTFAQRINSAVKCLNMVSKEERPLPAESHRVGEDSKTKKESAGDSGAHSSCEVEPTPADTLWETFCPVKNTAIPIYNPSP
ncbi:hypothetical protein U0070_016102 [Myodes glareolus]|uniref:Uncharacterized protein n=1 Tax=Myodes glareolus TaxID=447135 RepID=A0AAW0IEB3_MYOGA